MKQRGHHINQAARPTAGVPGDLTNLHASPLLKSRPRNDHQRLGPARPHKNNTCTINTAYAPHLLVASFQTIFGGPCACDTSVRQKLIRLWFSNSSEIPNCDSHPACSHPCDFSGMVHNEAQLHGTMATQLASCWCVLGQRIRRNF